jgi:hypothetical protein
LHRKRSIHSLKEAPVNGLGGLNKSPNGVVIGLVQLKLPEIATRADIAAQTEKSSPWPARPNGA